jgi:hypothetical protein
MKFAQPEILWALFALIIPILVHLFNFRRFKRIAFSNVAFLREVELETRSKNKLRHLLILLSRLLAMAFIIAAFAQPFIPLSDQASGASVRHVSLYIDNSFSMDAVSSEGRLLDLAKARALEVVSAYQATDRFNVLTNDLEGRHLRFYSQEDALDLISEIETSSAARTTGEIAERQYDLLVNESAEDGTAFLFTDLQKSTHNASTFAPDSSIAFRFIPDLADRAANVYVDSIWFDTPVRLPNQPEVLRIRIRHSDAAGRENVSMRLEINNQQVAIGSFNLVPGLPTDTALYFTTPEAGFKHAKIAIQDYPVSYDDDWFFGYHVAEQIELLVIKGDSDGRALRNIFGNDPLYVFTETDARSVNYGELSKYSLVVLDQVTDIPSGLTIALTDHLQAGNTALLIPAADAQLGGMNELLLACGAPSMQAPVSLQTKVSSLELGHSLYKGVFDRIPDNLDLPAVSKYYPFDRNARSGEEALMRLQNGSPFIIRGVAGEGQLFALAAPLSAEWTNFAQHALFVPTVLRMAELSRPSGRMDAAIGDPGALLLRNVSMQGDGRLEMKQQPDGAAFIPRHRNVRSGIELFFGEERMAAGNYAIQANDSTVAAIGMNYPRIESDLDAYLPDAWEDQLREAGWARFSVLTTDLETISKTIEELDEGKKLWDLFIVLALLFLLFEVVLIKTKKS